MTATPYQSRVGFFLSTESWKIGHADFSKFLQGSNVFFSFHFTGTNYYNSDSHYFFV